MQLSNSISEGISPWSSERLELLKVAKIMHRDGLVIGSSGNVSLRIPHADNDLIAITASSIAYSEMTLDHIVVVDHTGEPFVGDAIPSSELLMHSAIYHARKDVKAVMHTHSIFASALAVAGVKIQVILDEMVFTIGGEISVTEYAHPASEELGLEVVKALGEKNAALIKNHGFVGVGKTLKEAHNTCLLGEHLAKVQTYSSMVGRIDTIPDDIVKSEQEIFKMRKLSS